MFYRRVIRGLLAVALCAVVLPAPVSAVQTRPLGSPTALTTPLLAPSTPASQPVSQGPTVSAGVIYRVKSGNAPDQVAAKHGLGRSRQVNSRAPQVVSVAVPSGSTAQQVVSKLQSDPAVLYASPNYVRHLAAYSSNPNDTYFRDTSTFTLGGVAAPYAPMRSWWLRAQGLNVTPVWDALGKSVANYGSRADGSAFKVGVIDTGFYLSHEDRGANIVGGKDEFSTYSSATDAFTTDSDVTPASPTAPLNDIITASHGTCVAGEIAAATNNSLGVAAAGWDAQVRVYKVQGIWIEGDPASGYPANCAVMFDGAIINAIYDATDDGCRIINMSLGDTAYSSAMQDAIDYAHSHGVLVVAAAGNYASTAPFYPAACNNVLSVGAMGLSGTPSSPVKRLSSFSNYGPTLDVVGPGEYVWGLVQPGYDYDGSGVVYYPGYYWWQGTSMASPAVAGAIAALWRFQPDLTADDMVNYVEHAASAGGARTDALGYGYVDANAAYQRMKSDYPTLSAPAVSGLPSTGSFVNRKTFTATWPLQPGYNVTYASTIDGSSVAVSVAASASSTFSGLADGSHTAVIKSSSLRNWYDPNGFSTSFTVDTVAPVVATPVYNAGTKALSWSVSESNGLASQAVAITNTGTGVTTTSTVGPSVRGLDVSTLPLADYRATVSDTDSAGNTGQSAAVSWSTVPPPDKTPPQTTISALPNSWTKDDVTFSLIASDTDSPTGISTYYGLNSPPVTLYVKPVTVSDEGTTTIEYYSVDASSNAEETNTAVVRVDKTPPVVAGAVTTPPNAAGWYHSAVTAHFSASDALSGVAAVSPDAVLSSQGASQTVLGSATDVAGNAAIAAVSNLNVDTAAPNTDDDHVATYTASATIHLTAKDALSGVAATTWTLDGAPGSGTTVATNVLGGHTLVYRSTDVAGNVEGAHTARFEVTATDETPPQTTISALPSGWTKDDVTFSLTASDADSPTGISTYYGLNAPPLVPYSKPVTISDEGTTTIEYYSVDALSNIEGISTATVRIDKTPPVNGDDHLTTYAGTAVVHLLPSDALSGVASTWWTLDGTPGSGTIVSTSVAGGHKLEYHSDDFAGNSGSTSTVTFAVVPAPAYKDVYRFRNLKTGYYLWTADVQEKNTITRTLAATWQYEGIAYQVNTANPLNTAPLWRFLNVRGGYYLYTADPSEKEMVLGTLASTWRLEGIAFSVSTTPSTPEAKPVWRFRNLKNGTYFYTADVGEKNSVVATLQKTWLLEGPAFYLAP